MFDNTRKFNNIQSYLP